MTLSQAALRSAVAVMLVASSSTPLLGGDAEAGKTVFLKKCKICHGAEGQGNAGMAKVLKVEIRHLGSKEVQDMTDDEIKKAINEGSGKMKPVAGLSPDDVDNIVAFIRTLKEG